MTTVKKPGVAALKAGATSQLKLTRRLPMPSFGYQKPPPIGDFAFGKDMKVQPDTRLKSVENLTPRGR